MKKKGSPLLRDLRRTTKVAQACAVRCGGDLISPFP